MEKIVYLVTASLLMIRGVFKETDTQNFNYNKSSRFRSFFRSILNHPEEYKEYSDPQIDNLCDKIFHDKRTYISKKEEIFRTILSVLIVISVIASLYVFYSSTYQKGVDDTVEKYEEYILYND